MWRGGAPQEARLIIEEWLADSANYRLVGWSQWVDSTLSVNPSGIENNSQNRFLGFDFERVD